MKDIDLAGLHSGHSVDERQIRPLYRLLSIILSTGPLARIHRMDWADRTEDRGNAGKIAHSFFHPSGPSEFGYLIQPKSLIL